MEIYQYDKVKLTDGRCVSIIEIIEPGIVYIAEEPTPQGEHAYDDFFIKHNQIAKKLSKDYKLPNPYEDTSL